MLLWTVYRQGCSICIPTGGAAGRLTLSLPRYGLGRAAGCAGKDLRCEGKEKCNHGSKPEYDGRICDQGSDFTFGVESLGFSCRSDLSRHVRGFCARAADITPRIAAQLYAERYEDSLHRLGQTVKEHRKAAKIRACFAELPLKPMAQFTERDLQPVLRS